MESSIGIVGSGVSALHLGLFLLANDVPVIMYTRTGPEEIRLGRLPNTVGHHHHTLERERVLSVHHWDAAEYGYVCHHHCIAGDQEVRFRGDFAHPRRPVDPRAHIRRYRDWRIANTPKATNPSATAVSRNLPNGCVRIVCSAPSNPGVFWRSKLRVA